MWLLFCIISTILSGFIDVIEKKSSKEQPFRFIVLGLFTYNLFNIILSLFVKPNIIVNINFLDCLKVLPFCIFTSIGYYCAVFAFANGDISRVSPIMKSKTLLVLFLSTVFLNQKLSLLQIGLIFLILILNILLTKQKQSSNKENSIKGVIYAFGFFVFNGIATFLNKVYIIDFGDPIVISFYAGFVEIILLFFILVFRSKLDYLNIKKFNKFNMVILMETIEVVAILLNRYSLINGDVAIITTIASCSIIITLITSMVVFQEKISFKKWCIICLMIVSMIALSLLSL